jgi:hypothetical protein
MRIICIDRALGNQTWVQLYHAGQSIVLYIKHVHQPTGFQAIVHTVDDEENYLRALNVGIHRAVLLYIDSFFPHLRREAYAAQMEWEC